MSLLAVLLALVVAWPADSSASAVEDAAATALAEGWPDVAATVRVVRLSGGAERARAPLRVRFLDAGVPHGRASVEVEVEVGTGWTRAGWALLDVAHTETAAVLTRPLARGDAVTASDYGIETVETTRASECPLAPDSLAAGDWTADRPLAAGTVLTRRLLARPAAAERGETVYVQYTRGAVRLAFDAVARERGSVGDTVRVYDAGTRRTHRVRLTAPGQAVWLSTL